jgi:hypothetical protein
MSNSDDLQIIYFCKAGDPNYNETLPVSGPLTNTELRATPVPVSGTISTGGLTDAQLRASAVPVSAASLPLPAGAATAALQTQPGVDIGDVTINNTAGAGAVNIQDGGNSITVDGTVTANTGLSQPVTDAQLRATPVPVSGTVSTGGLTDVQLRATPVPVSGTITATVTGVSTAANQTTIIGHVDGIETAIASTNTKLDTIITNTDSALTDTELRASAVPVSLASVPSHPVTNAGTFAVQASQTGAWTVNLSGDSVSSQTALTTVATVSGSAGTFHGGSFLNLNSAPAYLQVFDTTGAVTLGTTTPTFVQPIPANSTAANGAGFVFDIPRGITMSNGIRIAATTTPTGATTVSTALIGFVTYR